MTHCADPFYNGIPLYRGGGPQGQLLLIEILTAHEDVAFVRMALASLSFPGTHAVPRGCAGFVGGLYSLGCALVCPHISLLPLPPQLNILNILIVFKSRLGERGRRMVVFEGGDLSDKEGNSVSCPWCVWWLEQSQSLPSAIIKEPYHRERAGITKTKEGFSARPRTKPNNMKETREWDVGVVHSCWSTSEVGMPAKGPDPARAWVPPGRYLQFLLMPVGVEDTRTLQGVDPKRLS